MYAVCLIFMATLALFLGTLSAARFLHNDLLHKVIHAIPAFFDVTPAGRIINRMSHDVDTVDNDFPATLRAWMSCLFSVVLFHQFTQKKLAEASTIFLNAA